MDDDARAPILIGGSAAEERRAVPTASTSSITGADHSAFDPDSGTFTVTTTIPRVLTLEFYENGGDAGIILNATMAATIHRQPEHPVHRVQPERRRYLHQRSDGRQDRVSRQPSVADAQGLLRPVVQRHTVASVPAPLPASFWEQLTYVEVSTDGGFNWATLTGENLNNTTRLPPSNYWDQRTRR
ncbi:MAG: hypothetical protein M5U34_21420 [Chloroflexi bacterium]|nr:hypothetical protein [Chloroflexota bacterium]